LYDKKGMTKRFRPWDPKQKWLLPPEITEFIPEGHPAHFVRIKQAMGFRQFLLRGLAKVTAEWQLVCTAHNLLKLVRAAS